MSDFYSQMAAMTSDLLATTSEGGLGQGSIVLVKMESGGDPNNPWADPVEHREPIKGVASGIESKLVGTEYGSTVLLASDKQVVTSVPTKTYDATDSMELDGVAHNIIAVQPIPALGVASAYKFIVRK